MTLAELDQAVADAEAAYRTACHHRRHYPSRGNEALAQTAADKLLAALLARDGARRDAVTLTEALALADRAASPDGICGPPRLVGAVEVLAAEVRRLTLELAKDERTPLGETSLLTQTLVREVRTLRDKVRRREWAVLEAEAEVRRLTERLALAEARTAVPVQEIEPMVCGEGGA